MLVSVCSGCTRSEQADGAGSQSMCSGALAGGPLGGRCSAPRSGRLFLYLRREHKEAVGLDDFLALG